MLLKLIAIGFVALSVGKIFFKPQMEGLGKWFSRLLDTTLIVIAIVLVVQLTLILTH